MQSTQSIDGMARTQKSTIVRTSWRLRALRWSFHQINRIAPHVAARLAVDHMFRVPTIKRPAWESLLLSKGERFDLAFRDGHLACWSWGEGPVVLLVHGWAGRGSQLGMLVEPLVRRGFRVLAFDGPGHGDTTVRRASMADQAAALQVLANHLGDIWGVVAHSMGAGAAIYATTKGLESKKLVLLAAAPDATDFFEDIADLFGLDEPTRMRIKTEAEKTYDVNIDDYRTTRYAHQLHNQCLVIHDYDDKEIAVRKSHQLSLSIPHVDQLYTHGLGHRRLLKDGDVIARVAEFLGLDVQMQNQGALKC